MKRKVLKKWCFVMVAVLSMAMFCGCGKEDTSSTTAIHKETTNTVDTTETTSEGSAVSGTVSDALSSIMGAGAEKDMATSESTVTDEFAMDTMETMDGGIYEESVVGDPVGGDDSEGGEAETPDEEIMDEENQARAGMLTAGEWDDNKNWGYYKNLFGTESSYHQYKESWKMDYTKRIKVNVESNGKAVDGAEVELLSENGEVIWSGVSRYDGEAYLFYDVARDPDSRPAQLLIKVGGSEKTVALETLEGGDDRQTAQEETERNEDGGQSEDKVKYVDEYTVSVDEAAEGTKKLDLMFMIDTTGSMGDEITYLQTELTDVVTRIKNTEGNTPVRISMNFYKDEGDSYVVDSHEFTEDVTTAQNQINQEYADGGGDYPEAVKEALEDAVKNHQWSEDSIKLMFLVLDAPPHAGDEKEILATIEEAAKKGIRIIPVASSGIDKETEFFLRAISIATGGTYTFLTNDSGIGDSHIEPTIGDYEVEFLNDLMVRVVQKYLGK